MEDKVNGKFGASVNVIFRSHFCVSHAQRHDLLHPDTGRHCGGRGLRAFGVYKIKRLPCSTLAVLNICGA
jgi:hypothetical protein